MSKEQTPSNLVIKAMKEVMDIFGPFKYFECQNWLSLKCNIEVAILEEIDWESFLTINQWCFAWSEFFYDFGK